MPSCSEKKGSTHVWVSVIPSSSSALTWWVQQPYCHTFMEGIATLKKNVEICGDLCLYILFIITTIILLFFFFFLLVLITLTIMILHFESMQISIHSLWCSSTKHLELLNLFGTDVDQPCPVVCCLQNNKPLQFNIVPYKRDHPKRKAFFNYSIIVLGLC